MNQDLMPILIGGGQITEKNTAVEMASTPMDLMEKAVLDAADNAGISPDRLSDLDTLVVIKSLYEFTRNSPESLARRINAQSAKQWILPASGNYPQFLVNKYAEDIANGKSRFALFAGTEAMATGRKLIKSGKKPDWQEPSDRDPDHMQPEMSFGNEHEKAYGIWPARYVYPLFENALRGKYGHDIDTHQLAIGRLFEKFTEVAADNPHSWYPIRRSAEEIAIPGPNNRFVSWPYTKYMNAMNQVNQSGAVLMTSVGFAKELGIPEEKWVYLHGCGDADEIWNVSQRVNYHSSPAIRVMAREAMKMADLGIVDIDFFDIYSCFPCAVQVARDELGIPVDDDRPLTVTGGLPYHGGAGSYSLNAIAAMLDKVRENPGKFGMVTANGGYLTKHAAGIYSTTRPASPMDGTAPWRRTDPSAYRDEIQNMRRPELVEDPSGAAVIETYTVGFGRDGEPDRCIIVGRLGNGSDPDASRFLAYTPTDSDLLLSMTKIDFLNASGRVERQGKYNIFSPN